MDKWLQNNTFVRIFSLLLAILLWFVVYAQDESNPVAVTEHEYTIDITYIYDENSCALVDSTKTAGVILKGSPAEIRTVLPGAMKLKADLTDLEAGIYYDIPLILEGAPNSVQATVKPNQVMAEIARKLTVEYPVQVSIQGSPADGFVIGQPLVSPAKVYVTAQESELEALLTLEASVNVNKASSPITGSVKIKAFDNEGKEMNILIEPKVVDVIIPISSPFKEIPFNLQTTGQPADGYAVKDIKLSHEYLTIFGPTVELDRYELYPGPQIDLTGLDQTSILNLVIDLLDGTLQNDLETIDVTVEIGPAEEKTFSNLDIMVNGLADGVEIELEQAEIEVILQGVNERIENLGPDDLKVYIDVSNISMGDHLLAVNVISPRFTQVKSISNPEISVSLSLIEGDQ